MYNGIVRSERYNTYPEALARQIQLDAYGFAPTIHERQL